MNIYLRKQKRLKKQADKILKDLGIVSRLEKIGETNVVGSYAMNLMACEDIDIVVSVTPNYDDFVQIVDFLFKKPNVYKLDLQDFRKSVYPNRPQGIYCGVTYLVKPDIFWKIDIWLFLPKYAQGATKTIRWVEKHMSEEKRDIILTIKNQVKEQLPRGKQITGMDVYKAVLENGVTSLEEFKHYLGKSGKNWE